MLRIFQRVDGYRFNLDAVFLAAFAVEGKDPERPLRVIDLGTGSGVVALLIARGCPQWQVSAVEAQPSMADLARRNAELNALPVTVIEADWRTLGTPGRAGEYDLVVCNPPYFAMETGHLPSDADVAAARYETRGSILDTVRAARRLVKGDGSVRFVYGIGRLPELLRALDDAGLALVRLRMVHAKAEDPAYAALVEAAPGSRRPLIVERALIVHEHGGGFSDEVKALVGDPAAVPS